MSTKSQPGALTGAPAGDNAPVGRVLLDSWHPFSAQGKDVLPSDLLGPGAPSASTHQCFLPRLTSCPTAFPLSPADLLGEEAATSLHMAPSASPQHGVNTRTYQSCLQLLVTLPFPRGGFKGRLPGLPYLLSHLLPGSGTGSGWLGEAWLCCLTPATQQLWITCAGESMASCSISASSPGDVCERFWPAAQPRCPHPTEYPPAHKEEGSSVLFLSGISHLPLRHMPHLSPASSPSCSAPRRRGGGACGYCPGKHETRALDSGLAAGSALGSSPPCSSTSPGCHRRAPKSVPMVAPGSFAGGTAEPWPCSPRSPRPRCSLSAGHPTPAWPGSSHLYATSFTGTQMISPAPPVAVTQLSCYCFFDAWCRHGPQPD